MSNPENPIYSGNFENKENLNTEVDLRQIYGMIVEMDMAGQKKLTLAAREYIDHQLFDESGNIRPARLDYFRKLVEDVYYGDFATARKLFKEEINVEESASENRKIFSFPFVDGKFGRHSYIRVARWSPTVWLTGHWGGAYSTTCVIPPKWMLDFTPNWEPNEHPWLACDVTIDGLSVTIKRIVMPHENGTDYCNEFVFSSKEDADEFGNWLKEKEKKKSAEFSKPEEKITWLANMNHDGDLLDLSRLDLLDKKYLTLADIAKGDFYFYQGYSQDNEGIKRILDENNISSRDLYQAVQDFFAEINGNLKKLTDKAVEELKSAPDYKISNDKSRLEHAERLKAISVKMLDALLDGWLPKIVLRAKELGRVA